MDFKKIGQRVAEQFARMTKAQNTRLFRVSATGDELWNKYITSFPVGSNPVFRKRTQHDCSCCRNFVKNVGGVISVSNDGVVMTVWDALIPEEPAYQAVANSMREYVSSLKIADAFLASERRYGQEWTFDSDVNDLKWNHFSVNVPSEYHVSGKDIPSRLNVTRTNFQLLSRALNEIDVETIDTDLDLVSQGSLYRGEEHLIFVKGLRDAKFAHARCGGELERDRYEWFASATLHPSVSRIRNTSIGTLLVDLAEGKELEDAVKSFEAKVAPQNYRRPTALVSKKMVEDARNKVESLGLTSALRRRFARLSDVSVNDVLFVDRNVAPKMSDTSDPFAVQTKPNKTRVLDRMEEISIEKFVEDVLPRVDKLEIMFEGRHANNLVSLIAPADPTAERLFKWANGFSWSYKGEFADSIKERVKSAGGKVDGDVRFSLSWKNHDDLDLHVHEPSYQIYFNNKGRLSPSGGVLDVDMNAGVEMTRDPVENVSYASVNTMRTGTYRVCVDQFCVRENKDVGFELQYEHLGRIKTYVYAKPVRGVVNVLTLDWNAKTKEAKVTDHLPFGEQSREHWGIKTQEFARVSLVTLSPNHWDGAVGNKHYVFALDGCVNDGTARGFFNEFLRPELDVHRKVLEMVGGKTKVEHADDQISGLGFSSTKRDELVCRVSGNITRTLKIKF